MWCDQHPTYTAKREPAGLCGRCWQLWFYKNPEAKDVLQRTYQEAGDLDYEERG